LATLYPNTSPALLLSPENHQNLLAVTKGSLYCLFADLLSQQNPVSTTALEPLSMRTRNLAVDRRV